MSEKRNKRDKMIVANKISVNDAEGSYRTQPRKYRSPLHLFFIIVLTIFFCEAFIMMILSFFPALSFWHKAIIDSTVLVTLLSPALYLFIIRPFLEHNAERIQAEETLSQTKENIDSILKSVPDIIYRLDAEGRITFVNDTINQYGYRLEGLIGRPIWDIVHPDDRRKAAFRINERRTGDRCTKTYQIRLLMKNQSAEPYIEEKRLTNNQYTVNFRIFNVYAEGLYKSKKPNSDSFLGTQGIARDITHRKGLENQLNQARTMQAIGTLAGGIAHDFNNLLMGIQGHASLMLLDLKPGHPHYEKLKNVENYVEQGGNLTKQLLGLAKGGKFEVKSIDLNDLLKNHNRIFSRTKKEITIHETYGEDIWSVNIDAGQIQQVFMNLYVNAYQAMPNGGDLYVQTENIILEETDTKSRGANGDQYVKISVTDTGIGMDKATQQRIFDPFFTTKNPEKGTGLGLASVYGIVKSHEGMINVYSEKGKGSRFNIYLPANGKEVVKKEEIAHPPSKGSETALLVDDEGMMIEVGRRMIESLGYKVFTAQSGKQAIAVYKESQDVIDLVILDMIMPNMSGGEIYERLKKINPNIKVLLSSGYSMNGEAKKILDQGCNDFIQKPFNLKKIARKIREVLDN